MTINHSVIPYKDVIQHVYCVLYKVHYIYYSTFVGKDQIMYTVKPLLINRPSKKRPNSNTVDSGF